MAVDYPIPSALITIAEAALLFRTHPGTFREWVTDGQLRDYSVTKHRILLSLDELKALMNNRKDRSGRCLGIVRKRVERMKERTNGTQNKEA